MLGFLEFSYTFFFLMGIKKKKKLFPLLVSGVTCGSSLQGPVQQTGQTLASMLEVGAKLSWLQTPGCAPSWWPGLRAPV